MANEPQETGDTAASPDGTTGYEAAGIEAVRAAMAEIEDVDLPDDMASREDDSDPEDASGDPGPDDPGGPPPPFDGPVEENPVWQCRDIPQNDIGNGRRFICHFGEDVMWVPRIGWHTWDGTRWLVDKDMVSIRRKAQKISDLIAQECRFTVLEEWKMAQIERIPDLEREIARLEAALRPADEQGPPDADLKAQLREAKDKLGAALAYQGELRGRRSNKLKFARSTGNTGKIDALVKEASVGRAVPVEKLDVEPLLLNVRNGILKFTVDQGGDGSSRTARVELLPHDRDALLTKMAQVDYDPEATCPGFDAFLAEVQPISVMQRFLARWFGLSMTGLTGEQKMAFHYGSGANGKSVMADLMARLLDDYSATAKIESLTGQNRRSGSEATPDMMPLVGARFVRASEPDENKPLQEARIKEWTGGEPIMIRALMSDFIEYSPIFKLSMSGNHKPRIDGTDDGIWRRMMLVEWNVQIPEERRDRNLVNKLLNEAPGVLNWLVAGLLDYLEAGLQVPDLVLEATKEYRADSDPYGQFLQECCVVSADDRDSISAKDLTDAMNFWLVESGKGTYRPGTIARKLKEKAGRWRSPTTGLMFQHRKASTMKYDGIRFTDVFKGRFDARPERRSQRDESEEQGAF